MFLAVNLLDRYIESRRASKNPFKSGELHSTGVTCMFIASKYEDVKPLLMTTIFNKIGHQRISEEKIKDVELEILRSLSYKIGAPTPLEFVTNIIESVPQLKNHP
jgi:hypothetical protein